ncbi:electron transfer flavoprotein subunit beta/FixA family protein [Bacillus sp. B15-48]|uniref:electron transfer flavoprotein subunit beta/FixA family protein n=1 Tax=Bacillus sp. B15-48 TaxID=1548601 RepID=UPI00193F70E7|nr:electron transfer flavoprotein subunit beta/FixA family protein [Bacillus sp. B15-48]MBM4762865.1 electron transfer flavoprotein subunit beta/FixA family protein [Bacillus sp. B15-48]
MKALVCYKYVPDEADIVVDQATKTLNMDKVKSKVSEYDRNAIELGVTLGESSGFTVESLTVGKNVKASTTDVLARGIEKAYYVEADGLESSVVAKAIVEAVKKIGGVDLVICGEGSGDQYSQQVGPRVAALLDYQLVSYVSSFNVNGETFTAERKLEDGNEIVQVSSPTVVTVLSDINTPRIPGMKQILSAKKKPSEAISLADLLSPDQIESKITIKKVGPSIQDRKQIRMNADGESVKVAVEKLVQQLKANKDI